MRRGAVLRRWSKLGSVLFLESPAGVGFSFCEEGTDCVHTDESTAADTADFFREFYKHYPELKSNDLYITGESYAGACRAASPCGHTVLGAQTRSAPAIAHACAMHSVCSPNCLAAWPWHSVCMSRQCPRHLRHVPPGIAGVYLPMLAEQLLEHQPDVNLKGIAVGNGCWGTRVGICAAGTGDSMAIATGFFHAHNMFDDALWDKIQKHCDWDHPTQVLLPANA